MDSTTAESDEQVEQDQIGELTASGVIRLRHLIVNSYMLGEAARGAWALIDTGLNSSAARPIIRAAERRFGRGSKPALIVLTHGHFDHVGAVEELAKFWDVPVYAHELELPYLTGRSSYPPPDPTVGGGLMARLAGVYPRQPIDLGKRVQALPIDGIVPGLPGWRWLHTPGHSPGHISLFRLSDHTLVAGDAFVTVKQESFLAILTQRQGINRPPAYYTSDWAAARQSLELLQKLEPETAATGHGIPMRGERLRAELEDLVVNFDRKSLPAKGRYVQSPAITDESGVLSVPPPVADGFPKVLGATVAGLALLAIVATWRRRRRELARK